MKNIEFSIGCDLDSHTLSKELCGIHDKAIKMKSTRNCLIGEDKEESMILSSRNIREMMADITNSVQLKGLFPMLIRFHTMNS